MRPGADQPPSARLPAHGARARGPGSLGSRHLFPARLAAAAAAAAAAKGRRVRANEHAHRGHARGEQTGRGAEIHPGPGWLPRSPGRAATAAPTGGSWSRPRPGPARTRRAAPQRSRSALTPAQARAPPATLAPRHPAPHGRLLPLREPSLCRQPDKAPARGPLHHLPETRVFVTCRWAPSPTHPHMPTHPHVPAPTSRAGCKPALLLGPSHSQTHAEGHNRPASPSHVEGPQRARPCGGRGEGSGRCPPAGLPWGGAERARPPGWRRAPPPLPAPPSSPAPPPRPAPPGALGSQPVSASGPIGLRRAVSQQAGGGTLFEAVRQWSWLCRQTPLPLLPRPGHFPGRVSQTSSALQRKGSLDGGALGSRLSASEIRGLGGSAEGSEPRWRLVFRCGCPFRTQGKSPPPLSIPGPPATQVPPCLFPFSHLSGKQTEFSPCLVHQVTLRKLFNR